MRAPIGRDKKRGEELPSSVEIGVGSGDRTGRKRVFGADADGSREGEAEAGDEVKGEGEGLRIVLAAGSWAEVSKTSLQPWCVFWQGEDVASRPI